MSDSENDPNKSKIYSNPTEFNIHNVPACSCRLQSFFLCYTNYGCKSFVIDFHGTSTKIGCKKSITQDQFKYKNMQNLLVCVGAITVRS